MRISDLSSYVCSSDLTHQGGTFVIPGYMSPLTIFLNFLTGLSLLVIAVDNAWRRLGEVLEATRREKAVADAILNVAPVSILQTGRDLRVVTANRYAHDLSHRLTPEIGRAAGRERGCQYV